MLGRGDIFHGRWFITRAREIRRFTRLSKVHLQAYRDSLRQVLQLLSPPRALEIDFPCPGPRRQIAHLPPLFHYLPSPPRLVFLIKCKYANGKTCTHLSRSLIVMLSILTERERFRREFLFYRSQIGFKNGCHNAFQKEKEKIVKKCSLNKWLNKFLGTTMVNNNSSSPYGGMANVRA